MRRYDARHHFALGAGMPPFNPPPTGIDRNLSISVPRRIRAALVLSTKPLRASVSTIDWALNSVYPLPSFSANCLGVAIPSLNMRTIFSSLCDNIMITPTLPYVSPSEHHQNAMAFGWYPNPEYTFATVYFPASTVASIYKSGFPTGTRF